MSILSQIGAIANRVADISGKIVDIAGSPPPANQSPRIAQPPQIGLPAIWGGKIMGVPVPIIVITGIGLTVYLLSRGK